MRGEGMKIKTQTRETKKLAQCAFCGHQGDYGQEIVDTDYFDPVTGRDTVRMGCRDLNACFERGGSVQAIY